MSEEQAEVLFNQYYPNVLEICRLVSGLADITFMRYTGKSGRQTAHFEIFVGHAMNKHYKNVQLVKSEVTGELPVLDDKCVVVKVNNEIISVVPWLHCVSRDNGHVTKLCGFKRRVTGGNCEFRVFGESATVPFPKSEFEEADTEVDYLLSS